MSGPDFAFGATALLAIVGALVAVGSRSGPIRNALGALLSLFGVAGALVLAGAPLVALLQLVVGIAVAGAIVLVSLSLVGTGRAALPAFGWRRALVRGAAALAAVLLAAAIGEGLGLDPTPLTARAEVAPAALGRALFRDNLVVTGAIGVLLLVAIVGSVALAGRRTG